jgi:oxygen-dependent protoporphyrinogen oxidase
MLKQVYADLEKIMGITAKPVLTNITRWLQSMPQYTMGHPERLKIVDERIAAHDGLFLAGASYRGVGVPDCMASGKNAALAAIEYVKSTGRK